MRKKMQSNIIFQHYYQVAEIRSRKIINKNTVAEHSIHIINLALKRLVSTVHAHMAMCEGHNSCH